MSRLGVYRKRPRTWATDRGIPVISTKWVDVKKGDAKQPESIEIVLERWGPTMPGTFASMGPFECVMFLFSKALMWKPGPSGPSARKIMFLDASTLSGGRDERDGNRVAARRASEGPRLGRRTLVIALRNEESSTQLGEEMAECAHRDELRDWYMVASYRLLS